MAIHIGCGSWTDAEYVGVLYPKGLPKDAYLRTYAKWFDRIEVNSTYHALPAPKVLANWAKQTPTNFIFDLKLHRAFSENPAKAVAGEDMKRLLDVAQPLIEAKKLGAFLLTLAPSFGPERRRLDELDEVAEKLEPHRLAVELRHRGWVDGDALATTLDYFRRRKLVWVALDMPRLKAPSLLPPIDEVTNPRLAYMRLHGRNRDYLKAETAKERHHHAYAAKELEEIAARIQSLAARAEDVHVSVNTHFEDYAPKAAIALRRLLGQPVRDSLPQDGGDDQLLLPGA